MPEAVAELSFLPDKAIASKLSPDLVQRTFEHGDIRIFCADALQVYDQWPSPVAIVVDGPYGIGGFPGDPSDHGALSEWYRPHAEAWFRHATPLTTLWFWCTEIGWAATHGVLEEAGWEYVGCNIWDKGVAHIAGNCNTRTIRKFPVVTEVCVQYVKPAIFDVDGHQVHIKEWLRREWKRSGLPLSRTNEAACVKNAATRKWFTRCSLWYFPPVEAMEKIVAYANSYGRPSGRPYFSIDGKRPITGEEWSRMRSRFNLQAIGPWERGTGPTNVWREPALRNGERVRVDRELGHPNQKPLSLISQLVKVSTMPGEVVWEPFGGLCTTAVACLRENRQCCSAEILPGYFELACKRIEQVTI